MTGIEVFYPSGRNLEQWKLAYRDGTVPDLWPYGLHKIRSGETDNVTAVEAKPLTVAATALAVLRQRVPSKSRDRSAVSIAWEEDLALRLAVERPRSAKFAGVIWATDRIIRRETSPKDRLLRSFLPRFDGLWALSRPQVELTKKWLGRSSPPVDFLRFGIDQDFFASHPYPTAPLVLSLGRDRDRDPTTLFEAMEEVKRQRPETAIAVQTSTSRPAPIGVDVLPMMAHSDLRHIYRRASVVVVATQPNVHVSGMTVALESMATARPIVITRTPGMEGYVQDGVNGLLVAPGDSKGMARSVLDLLSNPEDAAAMGRRGRENVEARHTSTQMANRLRELVLPS
jgi:glycosyltransferase involved in cell wall biosynthesis